MNKYVCELIGTFSLVFFGCATVIFMRAEVGLLGVAFAFGLSVVAMAYSIGPISGAHLNPAVSLGFFFAGRLKSADLLAYAVAQCAGAIVAAAVLYVIAEGKTGGYDVAANGFAQNGWSTYSMVSAFLFELAATFIFVMVILRATAAAGRSCDRPDACRDPSCWHRSIWIVGQSGPFARSGAVCRRCRTIATVALRRGPVHRCGGRGICLAHGYLQDGTACRSSCLTCGNRQIDSSNSWRTSHGSDVFACTAGNM
jgi:hypothetical protein